MILHNLTIFMWSIIIHWIYNKIYVRGRQRKGDDRRFLGGRFLPSVRGLGLFYDTFFQCWHQSGTISRPGHLTLFSPYGVHWTPAYFRGASKFYRWIFFKMLPWLFLKFCRLSFAENRTWLSLVVFEQLTVSWDHVSGSNGPRERKYTKMDIEFLSFEIEKNKLHILVLYQKLHKIGSSNEKFHQ